MKLARILATFTLLVGCPMVSQSCGSGTGERKTSPAKANLRPSATKRRPAWAEEHFRSSSAAPLRRDQWVAGVFVQELLQ